jgi:large subunit ribosomal protein L6
MSRVGQQPIEFSDQVEVKAKAGNHVTVKGPRGQLERTLHPSMAIDVDTDGRQIIVRRSSDERTQRALHGLTRSLLANMVQGVTEGFEKRLEIQGTGYRADVKGNRLEMALGYSHPVIYEPPDGVELAVEGQTIVIVQGIDKEAVGQTAAEIRMLRKVEPYKGKGIRYLGEHVRRKAGKAGKVGAGPAG